MTDAALRRRERSGPAAVRRAALALVIVAAACTAGERATGPRGDEAMIRFRVVPEQSEFMSGEDVMIRVEIDNEGTHSVELPDPRLVTSTQPEYHLVGPSCPDGVRFAPSRGLREGAPAPEGAPQPLTLEPGRKWSTAFALGDLVDVAATGAYRIDATLVAGGVDVRSPEAEFHVVSPDVTNVHVGLGARPNEVGEGSGAYLQRGHDGVRLYSFRLLEAHASIGEALVQPAVPRIDVDPAATDLGVPWGNASIFGELVNWIVWRDGNDVHALSDTSETPLSVPLAGGAMRLVQPPLKASGGPVEVYALDVDAPSVTLVRFDAGGGSIAWTTELPARPDGAVVALPPDPADATRYLGLVVSRDEGLEIVHAVSKGGRAFGDFRSVRVPGVRAIAGTPLAMSVGAAGQPVRIAALGVAADDGSMCVVAEAAFPTDGATVGAAEIVRLGGVASAPVAGAVLFVDRGGEVERREAVVVLADGTALRRTPENSLAPVDLPAPVVTPVQLMPGKRTTYVLCLDRAQGLLLEAL